MNARSRNHCFGGKAISTKCFECDILILRVPRINIVLSFLT